MKLITLLTDFGAKDGYAGILKGVIWKICPGVPIADISHEITPRDVFEGALTLGRAFPYFPEGTIHLAIVDPGVGAARKPIAVRLGGSYFVGPDNGLCSFIVEQARAAGFSPQSITLDRPEFWLPHLSQVFHGRDIFAPVAAHLAAGVPFETLGSPLPDLTLLRLPQPQVEDFGWRGEIIHIDHFGNLATNISARHLAGLGAALQVAVGAKVITGLVSAYAAGAEGQLIALIDSDERLSIAVKNGSAAQNTGARVGDAVEVYLLSND